MINYNRLGYGVKRDFTNFMTKISQKLKGPPAEVCPSDGLWHERFAIRAKKNRNAIYNGETCNIMDVALKYKGAYRMDFKDKNGRWVQCKMGCIPVRLCEFPAKEPALTVVYGFGEEPMPLLSNLKMQEKKKLCHIITKVYLLRWRIEEYFKSIFYALGYAIERVLGMGRTGIGGFLTKKVKSQQMSLFEHFKIEDTGAFVF